VPIINLADGPLALTNNSRDELTIINFSLEFIKINLITFFNMVNLVERQTYIVQFVNEIVM
jgi:hypothetical protein